MKVFNIRNLSYAISTALAVCATQQVMAADYKKIGDLEIYEPATGGGATIMMMLDNSGSMGGTSLLDDFGTSQQCVYKDWRGQYIGQGLTTKTERVVVKKDDGTNGDAVSFNITHCQNRVASYEDRMTRLQKALIPMLADPVANLGADYQNYKIGLGNFTRTDAQRLGGMIAKEAVPLTYENRLALARVVAAMSANDATPSAAAYAEAGAYMLGQNTTDNSIVQASRRLYGGSGFSKSVNSAKTLNRSRYVSPITDAAQCDGYGIYFLTDGEPNSTWSTSVASQMNSALNGSVGRINANNSRCLTNGNALFHSSTGGNWECMGEFAKILRNKDQHVKQTPILTAAVGFGSVFSQVTTANKVQKAITNPQTGEVTQENVYNCTANGVSVDAQNLCKLGEKGYGFGEGGFYYAQSSQDIADSVKSFISDITGSVSASPSGTIAIPTDPLSTGGLQPYAYTPMIQAELEKAKATWAGNLKKYHTINGTLYGADGSTRLYIPQDGSDFPYAINPRAADMWQEGVAGTDNSAITTGGTFARLPQPTATNKGNVRTVYVEDVRTVNGVSTPTLVRVGVGANGRLIGFGSLSAQYTAVDKAYILHFLGFGAVSTTETDYTTTALAGNTVEEKLQNQLDGKAPIGDRVLGGVHHSVPALLAYKGQFDRNTGNISATEGREDYVLYGSMDGALHMVNADNGEEALSFIPRQMFTNVNQRAALSPSGVGVLGSPAFGVDAPWTVNARYTYNYSTDPVSVSLNSVARGNTADAQEAGHMRAYGGLGMGGKGLYGLDLTDRNDPSLLFAINNSTEGFHRMGHIQRKPITASIKTGATTSREVLIFGGGYDMCYENPQFTLSNTSLSTCAKTEAEGAAVYMVDARTGALIASWDAGDHRDIKHSVVGEITALDRNNNGYIDHLYFADLGGQLFRVDLVEGNQRRTIDGISIKRRTVKVFDANAGMPNTHLPYRFYESPVVTFYTDPTNASQRFAVINVASGDRSSPLHKRRGVDDANRVYGIIDRDIATARVTNNLTTEAHLISQNLTNNNLVRLNGVTTTTNRDELINRMREQNGRREVRYGQTTVNIPTYQSMGWYYDLVNYDGMTDVPNLKALGPGMVTGSVYYSSVYSPDYQYGSANQCSAKIVGGTEYQMYCMPWGVCPVNNQRTPSPDGTLGYTPAGPGIRELAMTSYTTQPDENSNLRVLLGLQTTQERARQAGLAGINTGGALTGDAKANANRGEKKLHEPIINSTGYHLKVDRWYDLQSEEN